MRPTYQELLSGLEQRGRLSPKLGKMQAKYGAPPEGVRCKHCVSFYSVQLSKRYFKCERFGSSGGPGTDWRANWPGCGKFTPEPPDAA